MTDRELIGRLMQGEFNLQPMEYAPTLKLGDSPEMCTDLENKANKFADRQVAGFDLKDLLPLSAVRDIIAEAYKQGYKDATDLTCLENKCNQRKPPIPYECMSEETAKELEDILAKTREESVKYATGQRDLQEIIRQVNSQQLPKDIPNHVPKEEFRNRLNHKDNERL